MSYIALYREWRPKTFDDIVEQQHAVQILKNTIKSKRIGHAYLFSGTRGTGKTSTAHVFARAVNCLNPSDGNPCNECAICKGIISGSILDVIEIDAASNNSVDNIRDIREESSYRPTHATYKVYIIDEVHMLSAGAFNALLKTLEEPPEHIIFILATTEPQKLPATILSRCQKFDFRRISLNGIIERISKIAENNDIKITKDAASLIATMSDGALRDAISLLDQCISSGITEIKYQNVIDITGLLNEKVVISIATALDSKDYNTLFLVLQELRIQSKSPTRIIDDLLTYYRNLLIYSVSKNTSLLTGCSDEMCKHLNDKTKDLDKGKYLYIIKELSALSATLKWAIQPMISLETGLVAICENFIYGSENISLNERISAIERNINNMNSNVRIQPSPKTPVIQEKAPPAQPRVIEKEEHLAISSGKNISDWKKIIDKVRADSKVTLYTCLTNSEACFRNENNIDINFKKQDDFSYSYAKSSDNKDYLEKLLSDRFNCNIIVKCVLEKENVGGNSSSFDKAEELSRELGIPIEYID